MGEVTQQGPRRFGRYILLDRLGMGGMAEVYRAIMPGADGFRRDLVIKRILGEQARSPNFIEMFGHEARISALLHHPNIVQVFDFGLVDGCYFLAMELLRGSDLAAVIRSLRERQRPFPIPLAALIAQQVARGLGYAHLLNAPDGKPLNIVHRDISPSNIMCLRAGGVKLLDFGIASAMGEIESNETETGSFKGKLTYSAPEHLRNLGCDGRADLFALGAVLWEMLVGKRLFGGKTQVDKLHAVLERPIPAPSTLRADVPPELDRIVLKALERDPDQRYAPGPTMADELEQVVLDLKVQSRALPALLDELFGSAPSSAHLVMSSLPPEFLTVDPTPGPTPPPPPVESRPATDTPRTVVANPAAERAPPLAIPFVTTTVISASRARAFIRRVRSLPVRTKAMAAAGIVATLAGLGIAVAVVPGKGARAVSPPAISPPASSSRAVSAPTTTGDRVTKPEANAPPMPPAADPVSAPAQAPAGAAAPAPHPGGDSPTRTSVGAAAPARTQRPRPAPTARARSTEHVAGGRVARGLSIDPFAEAASRTARKP
ncbi:MAG: serine/threonine-protein kinase [Haliangium ochraceum]